MSKLGVAQSKPGEAPFAVGGGYEDPQPSPRHAPGYTAAEQADAYKYGRGQRLDTLAKNRCATTIFDRSEPVEAPERTLFGIEKKQQKMARTAAEEVGVSAREGIDMYKDLRAQAKANKMSKDSGSPLDWGPNAGAPGSRDVANGRAQKIGATALEGMDQYMENKRAAQRNKGGASKGDGSPIKWSSQSRPGTAQPAAASIGGTANEGYAQYLENKKQAAANKASKDKRSPLAWGS